MCIVPYAIMQVLTKIQNLVPDATTRESDHQEAQLYDDMTLLEEMRTQIRDILAHRFPTYVNDIKTPLDQLQNAVISGSSRAPAVSAYPHKSILILTYRAQWLMVLTIQTSMLIQGVLEIVKEATTSIET